MNSHDFYRLLSDGIIKGVCKARHNLEWNHYLDIDKDGSHNMDEQTVLKYTKRMISKNHNKGSSRNPKVLRICKQTLVEQENFIAPVHIAMKTIRKQFETDMYSLVENTLSESVDYYTIQYLLNKICELKEEIKHEKRKKAKVSFGIKSTMH